jgi:hypothetical protein
MSYHSVNLNWTYLKSVYFFDYFFLFERNTCFIICKQLKTYFYKILDITTNDDYISAELAQSVDKNVLQSGLDTSPASFQC